MGQNLSRQWNNTSRLFLLNRKTKRTDGGVRYRLSGGFYNGTMGNFLSPYKQAVDELKVKLKGMRSQFGIVNANSPIEFVTGRVKPLASIYDKTLEKGLAFEPSKQLGDELGDILWPSDYVSIC